MVNSNFGSGNQTKKILVCFKNVVFQIFVLSVTNSRQNLKNFVNEKIISILIRDESFGMLRKNFLKSRGC